MAFLRKRASGNYALAWKWKGKSYIKGLGTKDLPQAEQIKQDAVDQLSGIRKATIVALAVILGGIVDWTIESTDPFC